ncbi:MAG TPA: DegT/DnrJ/EryC1/StrS family aminotransferase [Chloroflexota bacterium]|nr:DegT/DnrJ/EryC1/StrS family aminotransferase [Chloroflexota bacterium]
MSIGLVDLHTQYQTLKSEIDAAVARVFENADFVLGEDVYRFEAEFADYCEAKYAIGLDSGTSALELGLRALGVGPGDEVLVPANSFIASAAAVSFTGATPVFVDANAETYTIDTRQLTRKITARTKAIVPVHLYGQPADMDFVMEVAERYGLFVVEDACQAHGARWRQRRVGSIGHVGAFSFYPGKNLGAPGDGGAVVTNDPAVAATIRELRNCGQRAKYEHVRLGWTRRLDTVHAAVLRVKLRHLDAWNERRRQNAALYDEFFSGLELVKPVIAPPGEHVFHLYVVQVDHRDDLRSHLAANGVASGIHYPTPIHLQPAYRDLGYRYGDFPVSERSAARLLSLPMYPEIEARQIEFVALCIREFQMKG